MFIFTLIHKAMDTLPKLKQHDRTSIDTPDYGAHHLYQNQRSVINALINTSLGSVTLYDFKKGEVMFSQWNVLKSLGYQPEEFKEVSDNFFKSIGHPENTWVIENHIQKVKLS